jgi:hypothetical protein
MVESAECFSTLRSMRPQHYRIRFRQVSLASRHQPAVKWHQWLGGLLGFWQRAARALPLRDVLGLWWDHVESENVEFSHEKPHI